MKHIVRSTARLCLALALTLTLCAAPVAWAAPAERGPAADPNGLTGDSGAGMDPDGLNGESGPTMDPNG